MIAEGSGTDLLGEQVKEMSGYFTSLKVRAIAAATVAVFGFQAEANAQNAADFVNAFSGDWVTFEKSVATPAGNCAITLSKEPAGERYRLESRNCGGEFATIGEWGIVENQLALTTGDGLVIARLGGNQRRVTGRMASGNPIILDRTDQAGAGNRLSAAAKLNGCYYLGFTDTCAPEAELTDPIAAQADGGKKVRVIVNLNVRAEARDDANVIGVVPQASCVTVDNCVTASDGVWCEAKFDSTVGWLRKLTLRQGRWPIVTFTNGCQ